MKTYTKNPDKSVSVFCNGKHEYTIRKNSKKGYDKFLILADGSEYIPPYFSHFPTMKSALRFCGIE